MTLNYFYKKLKCISTQTLILITAVSFFTTTFPFMEIQAQPTNSFNPYSSKELIIGVRTAAEAIGNDVREFSSGGTCGVFGKELGKTLSQSGIKVKYTPIQNNYLGGGYERYDGLRLNRIHIECGPNSLPSSSSPSWVGEVSFSETPFYTTGIKLLINQSIVDDLPNDEESVAKLAGKVNILVSANTTTRTELEGFPNLSVIPIENRDQALDLLEQETDYAYASDALIVKTLLNRGIEEIRDKNGNIIQEYRQSYRNKGYTIYPPDSTYLLGETEKYAIAIKEGTSYEQDLMSSIEETINSSKMEGERKKLKKAEPIRVLSKRVPDLPDDPIIPDPPPNPDPIFPAGWILAILFGLLLLLLLCISILYFGGSRRSKQVEQQKQQGTRHEPPNGNVNISITSSPSTEIGSSIQGGQGNASQVLTREQAQDKMAAEIREILRNIDALDTSFRRARVKALKEGERLHEKNSKLSRRLTEAIEAGTISAIESAVDHPLAAFFIDGFKEFRNQKD